ncbi:MAG: aminoglycoside phosphotransferase family protein [Defluviitaleaceae bacterium]|nr:aminoglycoside phosphotransferase family protein [Defluviitaleaceae bacterium]
MIYDILKMKYPDAELTKLEGGYTNSAVFLKNVASPLIAKIYSKHGNASSEIMALTMLNHKNFSPHIYDYFEHDSTWCVIMDYLDGSVGQRYLDSEDIKKSHEIYRLLGFHLAKDIHSICVDNNIKLPIIELENPNMHTFVPADLLDEINNVLNVSFPNTISLVHGDFGPQNVIIQPESLKVVDWEFAGWGNPLYDIAWVVWFVHLHYPHLCKELCAIFLNEYRLHSDVKINKRIIKAFATSRVVFILSLISMDNIEGRKEWIKRLRWTLNTDFVD